MRERNGADNGCTAAERLREKQYSITPQSTSTNTEAQYLKAYTRSIKTKHTSNSQSVSKNAELSVAVGDTRMKGKEER
jgi:hypothetical protein